MKITVARYIEGITLNDLEWLQNDDEEMLEFDPVDSAVEFLKAHGVTDEEIYYMKFFDEEKEEFVE